jgi:hypothetical protein
LQGPEGAYIVARRGSVRGQTVARSSQSKRSTAKRVTRRGAAPRPVTFEDVRRAAATLPGIEDGTSYGTPALKVRGKLLARVHQSLDCLVLRSDLLGRQILMQSAPEVFFITDHYRDYPWVLVRFATVDRRALADLLERAWREVAPKSLKAPR